jgi:tetratricopeptide (TPR) repeat protein
MGRERARKRQHLFLYFTCFVIIPFAVGGCLHWPKKWQGEQHLVEARHLMTGGNYDAALAENQTILDQYPQSLADQALFMMGQIYAHPENPNNDYQKSLEYFQRIARAYPESELKDDARLWVLIIFQIIDKEKEIQQLNEKIGPLEQTVEIQKIKLNRLQDQLEKLKNIDLKIEEEKRKVMPQSEDIKEKSNGKDSSS